MEGLALRSKSTAGAAISKAPSASEPAPRMMTGASTT
jgi:hypothetical protein